MTTPPRLRNDCFALPPGVDWTPVDEALARLRERVTVVKGIEPLPTVASGGRVLAADVSAKRSNPPYANSAVDGYGFAYASLAQSDAQSLPVVEGRAAAGVPFDGSVPVGSAIRILTGAMLPDGVDTVVLEEDTEIEDGCVRFESGLKPGANARKAGEDVKAGEVALRAGRVLHSQDLALLVALGVNEVPVRQKLRVGVLSTGDEIVETGSSPAAHQIFDANRPMLLDLLARWGMEAVDLGKAADHRDAVRASLDRGADTVDAILTSGGASAGDEDHMSALLNAEGQVQNWRIAVKPGRPLALGFWRDVPVFGLPGNPVAAFVCSLIFARPALQVMAGQSWGEPFGIEVPAAFSKNKKPGRREYLRARLNAEGAAEVFGSEGSGRISGLSWAEGLVELGDGAQNVAPGTPVRFLPYSGFGL